MSFSTNAETATSQETVELTATKRALANAGDIESLVAELALVHFPTDYAVQRDLLLSKILDTAKDDAYAYWLALQICTEVATCEAKRYEAQLQRIDPSNGSVWSGRLIRSGSDLSEGEVNAILEAIARSDRFDTYWNASVWHITSAIARTKKMDLPTATVTAIGIVAAVAIPQFHRISDACKGASILREGRLVLCRRVSTVLRRVGYTTVYVYSVVWVQTTPPGLNSLIY